MKTRTTLWLDKDLVSNSKRIGINLSAFVSNTLGSLMNTEITETMDIETRIATKELEMKKLNSDLRVAQNDLITLYSQKEGLQALIQKRKEIELVKRVEKEALTK